MYITYELCNRYICCIHFSSPSMLLRQNPFGQCLLDECHWDNTLRSQLSAKWQLLICIWLYSQHAWPLNPEKWSFSRWRLGQIFYSSHRSFSPSAKETWSSLLLCVLFGVVFNTSMKRMHPGAHYYCYYYTSHPLFIPPHSHFSS